MKTINTILNSLPKEAEFEFLRGQFTSEQLEKPIDVMAVDGDIIAYKTAAVCEQHFEGACDAIIDTTLREIATNTGVSLMRIYISGDGNFRKQVGVTKPYKGNRATMVHPQFLDHCKEYLETKYKAVRVHGYEADDGIATDMTVNGAIHCGIDKDILQVPGRHYNYIKKEWQTVDEEQAIITLHRQILMGDVSDNVPGLPGVGEKKAEGCITDATMARDQAIEMYHMVVPAKRDILGEVDPMAYFEEQSALITMVSSVDLDFTNTVYVAPEVSGFEKQNDEEETGGFIGEAQRATPRI